MNGDVYSVYYCRFKSTDTVHDEHFQFDHWPTAKDERDRIFRTFKYHVKSCWIMRSNPGLDLKPEAYGACLRRRKPAE